MIWSDAQIVHAEKISEGDLSKKYKYAIDRISLEIISGVSEYKLPSHVLGITYLTYRGTYIPPLEHLREVYLKQGGISEAAFQANAFQDSAFQTTSPGSTPVTGPPKWYLFDTKGQNTIKFYPTPSENLPATSNVWGSGIKNSVIVEFSAFSDGTVPDYRFPFNRRRVIKNRVLHYLLQQEGVGQSLKGSEYYKSRIVMDDAKIKDYFFEVNNMRDVYSAKQPVKVKHNWFEINLGY